MKLIALDLDGTTLNTNKEISEENIKAIKKVQEQGHIVVHSIKSELDRCDLKYHTGANNRASLYVNDNFNIPLEDTVAIGDESNDITMFNMAGVPIAMENANHEVKKHSDIVTLSSDDHVVAYAIEKYVLKS